MKPASQRSNNTLMPIVVFFTITKIWALPRHPSAKEQMKKMQHMSVTEGNGTLVHHNKSLPFSTAWTKPEGIKLSREKKSDREKHILSKSLPCGIRAETRRVGPRVGVGKCQPKHKTFSCEEVQGGLCALDCHWQHRIA